MNRGRCLCGSVTWELGAEPYQAFNCHCKMCRKAHGGPFGTYWFFTIDQIRVTGGADNIVPYRSSPFLQRQFCGVCGSVVPYPSDARDHAIAPGGCHDHGRKSDCNIFVTHNAPWHEITGDLPRHDDYPVYTGLPRVEEESMPEGPEGIVRGSCLCDAVEVHLDAPLTWDIQLPLSALPPRPRRPLRHRRHRAERRRAIRQGRGASEALQGAGCPPLHPGLLRGVRLEDAPRRLRARICDRSPRDSRRRSRGESARPHVRGLQGALVRDPGRPAEVLGVPARLSRAPFECSSAARLDDASGVGSIASTPASHLWRASA